MKAAGIIWSLLIISQSAVTQHLDPHPLIGTWEMISVKGVDADGNPFLLDTTSTREVKIITPTHYVLIAWDVDSDSLIFNRTMAGEVALEGERYIEIPQQASVQILDNVKVDFKWRVEGDLFIQSGKIERPDGKVVILEALTFRRVRSDTSHPKNPALGTWRQISDHVNEGNGEKQPNFREAQSATLMITPTHWMKMDLDKSAFTNVAYGTYVLRGDSVAGTVVFSTDTMSRSSTFKLSQRVTGDTLKTVQNEKMTSGGPVRIHSVYKRAD